MQLRTGSGKLRAIGVASPVRLETMSEIPTLVEQGLAGFEVYAGQGLVVPVGTSPEFAAKPSKVLQEALDQPIKANNIRLD